MLFLIAVILLLAAYNFWPVKAIDPSVKIDKILVEKSKRKLHLISAGEVIKSYRVALGKSPVGHKEYEGDNRTPEGVYTINDKNPNSSYYLNLGISYPNETDRAHAAGLGKSPGGDIKIHGIKNGMWYIGRLHRLKDWTAGCIAVTNAEMEEIYRHVPIGTPIEIKP
jgi:murein L,D-transpeptidase YafK